MQEVLDRANWTLESEGTLLSVAVPSRRVEKVTYDVSAVERLILCLAGARGRMRPPPLAWQTTKLLRQVERLMLVG